MRQLKIPRIWRRALVVAISNPDRLLGNQGVISVYPWVSEGFFHGGANNGFSMGSQKDFCKGANVAKFHFNHPKL